MKILKLPLRKVLALTGSIACSTWAHAWSENSCTDSWNSYEKCRTDLENEFGADRTAGICGSGVIRDYTDKLYYDLNRHMRSVESKQYCEEVGNILQNALLRLQPFSGTSYRFQSISEPLASTKDGDCFIQRGFLSTSTLLKFAKIPETAVGTFVVLQIEGSTGRPIEQYSVHPEEKEILFPDRVIFRVTRLDDRRYALKEESEFRNCPNASDLNP